MLCVFLPVIIVEQIMGLWNVMEIALHDYMLLFQDLNTAALNEWALKYSDKVGFSLASFLYILFVPGPLTFGLSAIWLRVIRGKDVFADMVFSGFSDFLRVVSMDTFRRVLMVLWSFLLLVPGIIAYYRYNLAFFLVIDNPELKSFEAISLSKYYMQQNKASRFSLDFSFIGWFILSVFIFYAINIGIDEIFLAAGNELSLFASLVSRAIVGAIVFAPVCAYRGVAAAEYYHRVICRDPKSFPELPAPGK
jgi:uncharacterized membrane protein